MTIGVAQAEQLSYSESLRFATPEAAGQNKMETRRTGTAAAQPGMFVNVNANHLLAYFGPNTILSFSSGLEAVALQSSPGTFTKTRPKLPSVRSTVGR